jgi:UDP-N-acetylmuramate--alanine ligase
VSTPLAIDLSSIADIHIVGIGGAGMSAIATVLAAMGHRVTGSDLQPSPVLDRLAGEGIEVHVGHSGDHVGTAAAVAISTAIPSTNPEVVAALDRGIPVLRRAELLAAIAACRRSVAVAGTHGKTTTSSMLAVILTEAGLRPSFLIGGEINDVGGGAVWDDGLWFVVEADESDGTFLELGAEAALVTNIEPDHLEHYGGFDGLVAAFDQFLTATPGPRVVCADDPLAAALAARTGAVTYGTVAGADWQMTDVVGGRSSVCFSVVHGGAPVARVELPVPGLHNARNACGALAMAASLGVEPADGARALAHYGGVARRFQLRGEAAGITCVDDYAHLPTEVAAALAAAHDGGWGRVVAVFQPHRYSRTAALWSTFSDAFTQADILVVTDIYPAGEVPRPGVTGKLVLDAVLDAHPGTRAAWMPNRPDLLGYLGHLLRPGDLCLTLGAGDLTALPGPLLEEIRARH